MSVAAGVVLAGGASARMGTAKAAVPWGEGTLLSRAVAALAPVGRVLVVRAPGQELPPLPSAVEVVEDARPGRGPLEGLLAGLRALGPDEPAFVLAVDMPFVEAPFAAAVLGALQERDDAAVPVSGGRTHPLAAAYRGRVAEPVAAMLAEDRLRLGELVDAIRVRRLAARTLPGGAGAVRNVNTPEELAAAYASLEKATGAPAGAPPGGTSASASAPAREVMAWLP